MTFFPVVKISKILIPDLCFIYVIYVARYHITGRVWYVWRHTLVSTVALHPRRHTFGDCSMRQHTISFLWKT